MPIYEYTCQGCQRDFEVLLRGGDTATCPSCGGKRLEKKFSVPAAHVQNGSNSLPICNTPREGSCGLPQCGMGGCGSGF